MPEYVPDHLYERLFQPWTLPRDEWALCEEDWARVDAITRLPWRGKILDFGGGDGTLAAMVCSRNPFVVGVHGIDADDAQNAACRKRWGGWPITRDRFPAPLAGYDGALCGEVLEHLTPEDGHLVLTGIKRELAPGAMLCVTVPYADGPRAEYPGHIRTFTWKQLGSTLRDAGFTLDEMRSRDISTIWLMAVCHA